jgi:hypothetical protein
MSTTMNSQQETRTGMSGLQARSGEAIWISTMAAIMP